MVQLKPGYDKQLSKQYAHYFWKVKYISANAGYAGCLISISRTELPPDNPLLQPYVNPELW